MTRRLSLYNLTVANGEILVLDLKGVSFDPAPGWIATAGAGATGTVRGSNIKIPGSSDWATPSENGTITSSATAKDYIESALGWFRLQSSGGPTDFSMAFVGDLVPHYSATDTIAAKTVADLSLDASQERMYNANLLFDYGKGSLAVTASSSDTSAATVAVSGSSVTVSAVASGTSTITITATTVTGLTRDATIAVTVV